MVCPFDVITYFPSARVKPQRTVAIKCDNCIDRQHHGKMPACVETCKVGALQFGDVNELAKKARTRLGKSVSVAVSQIKAEEAPIPANLRGWREWGESVGRLNERA